MNKILAVLAVTAAMLTGCYLPEGTVRITGGSGESVAAENTVSGDTVIQATVNLNLLGEQTKGFEGLTYGKINIQDESLGLTLQGTVVEFGDVEEDEEDGQGFGAYCVGRAKVADSQWVPVEFIAFVSQNPVDVPGDSGDNLRHILYVDSSLGYEAIGLFLGGNFVFHGENGVIAR